MYIYCLYDCSLMVANKDLLQSILASRFKSGGWHNQAFRQRATDNSSTDFIFNSSTDVNVILNSSMEATPKKTSQGTASISLINLVLNTYSLDFPIEN